MKAQKLAAATVSPLNILSHRQSRYLARQPIFDRSERVVAYELLFRAGADNVFSGDQEESTRQILDNVLVMGAEDLSSDTLIFVNCTREALVNRLVTLLPPRHTVLEVLETVTPDAEVIAACCALKKMGYRIALDDFFLRDDMGPLIEIADYIKIDFQSSDAATRRKIRVVVHGSHAALLAEKIETETEFATAMDEGYDYFQGYFFCRPTMLSRDEVRPNHLNYLRLLVALNRPSLDQREIERIVMADAPFCFRLLRLANSPIYGMRTETDSVRRALLVVGEYEFRKLDTVAMAGSLGHQRPHALISLSLQRARLCELLAPHLHQDPAEQYLLGLLSLLDAILQAPITTIVDSIPLRPELRSALLGEQNSAAAALSVAKSYESGDWTSSVESQKKLNLVPDVLNKLCLEASRWAEASLHLETREA